MPVGGRVFMPFLFLMPSTTTLAHIAITGCLYGDGSLALYAGESAEEEESLLAFEYGSESELSVVSSHILMWEVVVS